MHFDQWGTRENFCYIKISPNGLIFNDLLLIGGFVALCVCACDGLGIEWSIFVSLYFNGRG